LLEVLGLANQYGFVELQSSISEYLKAVLNKHNVCMIYDIANMYSLRSLSDNCCLFMDHNAFEVLQMEGFRSLSPVSENI
jgi:BTB/POZ domain-containing protein 9